MEDSVKKLLLSHLEMVGEQMRVRGQQEMMSLLIQEQEANIEFISEINFNEKLTDTQKIVLRRILEFSLERKNFWQHHLDISRGVIT